MNEMSWQLYPPCLLNIPSLDKSLEESSSRSCNSVKDNSGFEISIHIGLK
jgi:hypothetical protein